MLTGCTVILHESATNDVEKAARNGAGMIRLGLRGGFYGELITHEQKIGVMSLAEWDRILTRTLQLLKGEEMIHAGHDVIGPYLKGKDGVWIRQVQRRGEELQVELAGRTEVRLQLSVFTEEGDQIIRRYRPVDPFAGESRL